MHTSCSFVIYSNGKLGKILWQQLVSYTALKTIFNTAKYIFFLHHYLEYFMLREQFILRYCNGRNCTWNICKRFDIFASLLLGSKNLGHFDPEKKVFIGKKPASPHSVHSQPHCVESLSEVALLILVKFIYSEKATKFCKIFPLFLTVWTAFSEYMNFNFCPKSI